MKALFLSALFPLTVLTCQQEEKVIDVVTTQSQPAPETRPAPAQTAEMKPAEAAPELTVESQDEGAAIGKAIFTQNNKVMISFNSVSQKGKIKINGKDYALTKLTFSENNYEIIGDDITITANNGNFQEMTSDCAYGTFPEVKVKLNGKETILKDVKVQDCPNYN